MELNFEHRLDVSASSGEDVSLPLLHIRIEHSIHKRYR